MFEHPYLVVAAMALVAPFLPALVRLFFDGWSEAAEEIGLTSSHNRWRVLIGLLTFDANLYGRYPGIFLNIIWFLVALAAFVTTAYHVLLLLLPAVGVTLEPVP